MDANNMKAIHVGIIMGSQSDWPIMKNTAHTLKILGIEYESTIVSAHRTPDRLFHYAQNAHERGIKIIGSSFDWGKWDGFSEKTFPSQFWIPPAPAAPFLAPAASGDIVSRGLEVGMNRIISLSLTLRFLNLSHDPH